MIVLDQMHGIEIKQYFTFLQSLSHSKDRCVRLHCLLHGQPQICSGNGAIGVSHPI